MVSSEDHELLQAELASAQKEKANERTGMTKKVAELDDENKRLHGLLNELEGLERGSQESTVSSASLKQHKSIQTKTNQHQKTQNKANSLLASGSSSLCLRVVLCRVI
jgi:hypothetical protein